MYLKREKGVYVFILNNRGIVGEWRLFIFGLADRDSLGKRINRFLSIQSE